MIRGGRELFGEVTVSGAKNAAVAIIPAALLVDGVCRIENIPQISDVTLFFSILEELGARVRVLNRHAIEIDCHAIHSTRPSYDLARRIRASYYLLGALLGRFGQATVAMPGGCNFGVRPIDQHIKGFTTMGADIKGAGTDSIKIRGVERLTGGSYCIIPDQIEAGTYMAAVAATGGQLLLKNVIPKHMECISAKLMEMGVSVTEEDDTLLVRRSGPLVKTNVKTLPYPGFPTDMQPQITAVLALAEGTSLVTEGVYGANRFKYVDELKRLGAHIQVDGKVAVVEGVKQLVGAPIQACDLRAGAALVIAGLAAHGTTELSHIQYIERGYEDLVGKLRAVGADISIVDVPDESDAETHAG